jgi:HAD superfamily hydrolase (TIGR01450 family)
VSGTFIFDLDGVLYLGEEAVPGAARVLEEVSDAGCTVLFATNNSYRTRQDGADKIRRVTGFDADPEQFVSSSLAAASMLGPDDGPVYMLGGPGVEEAIDLAGLERTHDAAEARSVVAGLDRNISYESIAGAATAIRRGARFIATNLDATFPSPNGLLPGAGTIIAAVRTASETEPEVAGKPFAPIRTLLNARSGGHPTWMVGDRPDTDLAMAVAEGWTSVLVLTGVVSDAEGVDPKPDFVLMSIAELSEHLSL